jgi:hypothetical protein
MWDGISANKCLAYLVFKRGFCSENLAFVAWPSMLALPERTVRMWHAVIFRLLEKLII